MKIGKTEKFRGADSAAGRSTTVNAGLVGSRLFRSKRMTAGRQKRREPVRQATKSRIRRKASRSGLELPAYLRELILLDDARRPAGTARLDTAELQDWLHDLEADRVGTGGFVALRGSSRQEQVLHP